MKPEEQELFLLSLLTEQKKVSREVVMEQLHIKRRTLFLLLERLRQKGHIIQQRQGNLFLLSQEETYPEITKDVIRYWWIIKLLQDRGGIMTEEELIRSYPSGTDSTLWCKDTLHTVLGKMCEYSLLKKEDNNTYRLFQAPLQIALSNADAEKLLIKLKDFKKGTPDSELLDHVYEKIEDACPDVFVDNTTVPYYAQTRPSSFSEEKLAAFRRFSTFPYDKYALNINYRTRSGNRRTFLFKTGLFLYSEEKGRFYIVGETDNSDIILDIEQIEGITATDVKHTLFRCNKYMDMAKEMFGISVEGKVHVKVQFDNVFNIREKLERLCETRSTAILTETSDHSLLFEDTIRGLTDFANYLRRFGRSAIVLEPETLRQLMRTSAERTLERYERITKENSHD